MLSAQNLSYRIGKSILVDSVNLELNKGEVVALVGANGAGKTTLLRLLSGELEPTQGVIYLDGQPLYQLSPRQLARKRAVMRQHIFLNFDFTAYDVVMMGRHPHIRTVATHKDHQIADAMLQRTETDPLRDQLYATLSGGEKSRVTLARVLAQETPILLLDEPTSTMDLRHQQMTMRLARNLADQGGTVLAVLHDLNLAAMYADRIGMMIKGQLVAIDTPQQVLTTQHIEAVFNLTVRILEHPDHHCPLVVPIAT
ncbi:MAG: heme ABC transporter ATP-binding protein [Anaerolineales bacterium]|nr:heme ABC transporter ATP-binding protein [Anaerolineales bacterium]